VKERLLRAFEVVRKGARGKTVARAALNTCRRILQLIKGSFLKKAMITRPNQVRVLLDANIVDKLMADRLFYQHLRHLRQTGPVEILISALQVKELKQTPCDERRTLLLETLDGLSPHVVPAPGFFWDITDWDQSEWSSDEVSAQLLAALGKQSVDLNAVADASLPPTAYREVAAIVSDNQSDVKKALDRFRKVGGTPMELWSYPEFKKQLSNL